MQVIYSLLAHGEVEYKNPKCCASKKALIIVQQALNYALL